MGCGASAGTKYEGQAGEAKTAESNGDGEKVAVAEKPSDSTKPAAGETPKAAVETSREIPKAASENPQAGEEAAANDEGIIGSLVPDAIQDAAAAVTDVVQDVGEGVASGAAAVGTGVASGAVAVGSGVASGAAAVGSGVVTGAAAVGSGVVSGAAAVGSTGYDLVTGGGKGGLEPSLGVVRLDYHYPPAPGDIDHPGSYDYETYYNMVKGLTFEMCQANTLSDEVVAGIEKTLLDLERKGVSAIVGDCGFMMWFQQHARRQIKIPVVLSSLASLPAITCAYSKDEKIAIFTANGETLKPMHGLIRDECGVEMDEKRFIICGCENVPGFEAVAAGEKVDVAAVTPGMVQKAKDLLAEHPDVKAILMECTELPPYSDAVREETGIPVFDAITMCDFFVSARMDNPRFGSPEWDDAKKEKGSAFGLVGDGVAATGSMLMKPFNAMASCMSSSQDKALGVMARAKAAGIKLGVIRLDYDYPPAPGDVDHPGSYAYEVIYEMVKGLTFEMCQSGKLTQEVEDRFVEKIRKLENEDQVSVISGDCGFMMWLQQLARKHTTKSTPVVMSSLASLPAITCAFGHEELIAIFTANGRTLEPMKELIRDECGVEVGEKRYIIVGCEDVPGFEAVALGQKVDVAAVTPGMVAKALALQQKHPALRAILMECTELPPYSDAVRQATGLPVFDAITTCDFFMSSRINNPKFGVDDAGMARSMNWNPLDWIAGDGEK